VRILSQVSLLLIMGQVTTGARDQWQRTDSALMGTSQRASVHFLTLCDPRACNREFRSLVAKSTFEKRDVDHIRALCITSFWLADNALLWIVQGRDGADGGEKNRCVRPQLLQPLIFSSRQIDL
jgi:hypothetical protein